MTSIRGQTRLGELTLGLSRSEISEPEPISLDDIAYVTGISVLNSGHR